MELFLQNGQEYNFLFELLISYLKLEQRGKVKIIYLSKGALKAMQKGTLNFQVPSLITEQGDILNEVFLICYRLIETMPHLKAFFLGSNQEEENDIKNVKVNLKEGKQFRKHLQKHLETRTFFVANHLTFADLFMFVKLYDSMIEMTDDQKNQYNNLYRWYRHIQNLPEIKEFLNKHQRLLVEDPQIKVPFLAEKKKSKK